MISGDVDSDIVVVVFIVWISVIRCLHRGLTTIELSLSRQAKHFEMMNVCATVFRIASPPRLVRFFVFGHDKGICRSVDMIRHETMETLHECGARSYVQ